MALIPPEKLRALVAPAQQPDRQARVPYPPAAGVLYAGPNPDGTRKACRSCWKWIIEGRCLEVAGEIDPGAVCGSHVFGKPQSTELQAYTGIGDDSDSPVKKMSAAEAGLIMTPSGDGTSCDLCRFFTPGQDGVGMCEAIGAADGMPPVAVDSLACCARWEAAPER